LLFIYTFDRITKTWILKFVSTIHLAKVLSKKPR